MCFDYCITLLIIVISLSSADVLDSELLNVCVCTDCLKIVDDLFDSMWKILLHKYILKTDDEFNFLKCKLNNLIFC